MTAPSEAATPAQHLAVLTLSVALIGGLVACSGPTTTSTPTPNSGAAGCLRDDGGCLGALSAGEYESVHFDPFRTEEPGQLRYTVDDSWANSLDHRNGFFLHPVDAYLAGENEGGDHWGGVFIWAYAALAVQDGSCAEAPQPGVGTDAASIAAALHEIPGLTLTDLPNATVGGYPAIVFETEVAPGAPGCDDGYIPLIASREGSGDPFLWATGEHEGLRGYLVDLGDDLTLAIMVNGPRADIDVLVAAAEDLIEDFELVGG